MIKFLKFTSNKKNKKSMKSFSMNQFGKKNFVLRWLSWTTHTHDTSFPRVLIYHWIGAGYGYPQRGVCLSKHPNGHHSVLRKSILASNTSKFLFFTLSLFLSLRHLSTNRRYQTLISNYLSISTHTHIYVTW